MREIPILMQPEMVAAIIAGRKTQTRRVIKPQPIVDKDSGRVFDGHKPVKRSPFDIHNWKGPFADYFSKWQLGDVLYVRESWKLVGWDFEDGEARIQYEDGEKVLFVTPHGDDKAYEWIVRQVEKLTAKDIIRPEIGKNGEDEERLEFTDKHHPFSPSIHLPKWCSRIWLEVVNVRVERLHDIKKEDAIAEGILHDEIGFKDYDIKRAEGYGQPDVDYPHVQDARLSFLSLWEKINGFESRNSNPWVWVIEFKVLTTEGEMDFYES